MVEESLLGLTLAYPETRMSLEDLTEASFSVPETKGIFVAVRDAKAKATLADIALGLPELADYAKILALQGEEQFGSVGPADRGVETFTLARRLQKLSGNKSKELLTTQIQAAEASGDTLLARSLLEQYQALIKE